MHPTDEELAALLRLLDHQPPAVDVETVIAAARRRRHIRVGPIAAGIVLCAAVAAAAIPGSPVRAALERVFTAPARLAIPSPTSAPDTTPGAGTGIALVPGSDLDIRFRGWQKRGQLRVSFADAPQLSLVPHGGDAAFAVRRGQVAVDNRESSASFTLEVPRTVQRLRVYVDTTVVLRKTAGAVSSLALPDGNGAYTIDLSSPPGIRSPAP